MSAPACPRQQPARTSAASPVYRHESSWGQGSRAARLSRRLIPEYRPIPSSNRLRFNRVRYTNHRRDHTRSVEAGYAQRRVLLRRLRPKASVGRPSMPVGCTGSLQEFSRRISPGQGLLSRDRLSPVSRSRSTNSERISTMTTRGAGSGEPMERLSAAERGSRRCCRTLSHVSATRSAILQTSGDLKNRLQSRDKP